MSADTTKKRRVEGGDSQGDNDVKISEGGTTMAAILAEMKDLKSQYTSLQNEMNGMKDKCTYLENRCDSLQRSVQILSKESKWKYSAPSIPLSHWIDQDFDEEYIKNICSFVNNIKEYTCQLRSGKLDHRSNVRYLNLELKGEDDEESIVLVPKVLESIHNYSAYVQHQRYVRPLSIMFELLRGWKMPEIYESRVSTS